MKPKIVDDFIAELLPNKLDVNRSANDLQSTQLDYILLIRKLIKSLPAPEEPLAEEFTEVLKLDVKIESAMRLRNPTNQHEPPSAFVRVVSPYSGSMCEIETSAVNQSCYPYWPQTAHKLEIPLSAANLHALTVQQLEFQVFTKTVTEPKLIGVAFVDISSLYVRNSAEASAMISGYYHVVDRNVIRNSMQMTSIDSTAMGNLS